MFKMLLLGFAIGGVLDHQLGLAHWLVEHPWAFLAYVGLYLWAAHLDAHKQPG